MTALACIACTHEADGLHLLWGALSCPTCAHGELAEGARCEDCDYRRPRRVDGLGHLQQMAGSETTLPEARWLRDRLLDLGLLEIDRLTAGDIWHLTADDAEWDEAVAAMADRWQQARRARCPECGRTFDLADPVDADEWSHGHDCEA